MTWRACGCWWSARACWGPPPSEPIRTPAPPCRSVTLTRCGWRWPGLSARHPMTAVKLMWRWTSGSAPAIGAALARLDIGGRLVLAGSVAPGPPVPVDPERVVRGWLTVTGVHNYEPRHLRQAVAMLDRYRYPWASLVAPPVPLADIATVFSRPAVGLLRMSVKP